MVRGQAKKIMVFRIRKVKLFPNCIDAASA